MTLQLRAGICILINGDIFSFCSPAVNKHKPWIETTYHGIVTENDDKVLLDPPLIALDKDAPLRYAGERGGVMLLLLQIVMQMMDEERTVNVQIE